MQKTDDRRGQKIPDAPTIPDEEKRLVTPAEEGERAANGSQPATTSDDDVAGMVEDVIGNEPEPGKPFSLAEEVEKDERARYDIPPDEANLPDTESEEK